MVNYANGNPVALKALGSYIYCRREEEWKCASSELKKVFNKEIHNVLKTSYDGLNENQKEIFLDISCFFIGEEKDHVERKLDGCRYCAEIGIPVLVDESLITIRDKKIQMHNLLQEMGREIVRQESVKDAGKPSRLFIPEESYQVLRNGTVRA